MRLRLSLLLLVLSSFWRKPMNIREAITEDATQIKELVVGLSHFYLSANDETLPKWLSSTLELREFESRLKNNEFTNLVCENNKNIIGYISIKNKNHIYHLFVSQEHQRKGIAKKLWEKAKILCQSSTYTVRSSLYAVPVYEHFGFSKSNGIETKDNLQFQAMEL